MMPRYKVVEKRSYESTVLIDAANENDAKHYAGDIVYEEDNANGGSVGEELLSVEQVADDFEG